MILLADSGSTKTHWCLCTANGQRSEFRTEGINPFYQTEDEIAHTISDKLLPQLAPLWWIGPITHVYFYGAGCAFAEQKQMVAAAIATSLHKAEITVESDLLAAAHALCGHQPGIACILGTGSNSCLYNGTDIVANVSPLGYVLGDEGSGAYMGKMLVANLLKNQLPSALKEAFLKKYDLTPALILESVYKKPFPNRFLAHLSEFVAENLHEPALRTLAYKAFEAFVQRNVQQYAEAATQPISFVGSVAYFYREVLVQVLTDNHLHVGTIAQSPMDGLVTYHRVSI